MKKSDESYTHHKELLLVSNLHKQISVEISVKRWKMMEGTQSWIELNLLIRTEKAWIQHLTLLLEALRLQCFVSLHGLKIEQKIPYKNEFEMPESPSFRSEEEIPRYGKLESLSEFLS